jgi:hypothetical protein
MFYLQTQSRNFMNKGWTCLSPQKIRYIIRTMFTAVVCFVTLSSWTASRRVAGWLINLGGEGGFRSSSGLDQVLTLNLSWRDWENHENPRAGRADVSVGVQIERLPNTRIERYSYSELFRSIHYSYTLTLHAISVFRHFAVSLVHSIQLNSYFTPQTFKNHLFLWSVIWKLLYAINLLPEVLGHYRKHDVLKLVKWWDKTVSNWENPNFDLPSNVVYKRHVQRKLIATTEMQASCLSTLFSGSTLLQRTVVGVYRRAFQINW